MDAPSATRKKQIMILVGGIATFLGVLVAGMYLSDPNRGKPTAREIAIEKENEVQKNYKVRSSSAVTAEESWIAKSETTMAGLQLENQDLKNKLTQLTKKIEALEKKGIQGTPVSLGQSSPANIPSMDSVLPPPPAPITPPPEKPPVVTREEVLQRALPPPPVANNSQYNNQAVNRSGGQGVSSIQVVSLVDESTGNKKEKDKVKNISSYLPTGSFASAVLLSGMDAPTGGMAQTNPVPVLMRIINNGQLPNFFNSEINNCHVTGAGYGDMSSERAIIRLEMLSCVLVNGDIIEAQVKGYVAGEDGKNGMRGRVVEKTGALLAKSAFAGIASGMGTSISQQSQSVATSPLGNVTTIDPNKVVQSGLATGSANALEKIADYYIARANETYPVIEVDANRIGEVILTGGTDLGRNIIGNTRQR